MKNIKLVRTPNYVCQTLSCKFGKGFCGCEPLNDELANLFIKNDKVCLFSIENQVVDQKLLGY